MPGRRECSSPLKYHCIFVVSFLCWLQPAIGFGQIEFTSSPNPIGSGARALGMGGAFIAIADDATAASWNPAGLIQLELPEISVVGAYFDHNEDNVFFDNPEANKRQHVSAHDINYLSASYPFVLLDRNMVVSVNYQHLYDFSRQWDFPFQLSRGALLVDSDIDYSQDGQLYAFGLAYAIRLLPNVACGLTLNVWEDGLKNNEWQQKSVIHGVGTFAETVPVSFDSVHTHNYRFSGFNVNIGLLWQLNDQLTVGGVFKSPFTADLQHISSLTTTVVREDTSLPISQTRQTADEGEELAMPLSYGIGFAYRFSDNFTTSFDVYRTQWDDFIHKDSHGIKTSFVSAKPVSESDIAPTTQVRLGAEYLFVKSACVLPLRFGLFYDPAPQEGGPDEYYGVTVGSGYASGKVVFDIAYQYRWADDVGASLVKAFDFSQDVQEHTLYTSCIIHF